MTGGDPGPSNDDDTFDPIDEALATLAQRRGVCPGDDIATIALTVSLIQQAERGSA